MKISSCRSKKFTFLSVVQMVLLSILLRVVQVKPFFEDILLNIAFGGFAYGMLIVLALKGGSYSKEEMALLYSVVST